MDNKMIRPLNADEIECRIGSISEKGISLLLYKDARVDQKLLDEQYGVFGWKRSHVSIDGNLYCTVSVKDPETGEWVSKQDVGTTGYTEKEKSQASDSFKRACFNWGIGRELYTAPFIWIPADKVSIEEKKGKLQCYDHFTVTDIGYNDSREICSLSIDADRRGRVYTWQKKQQGKAQATERAQEEKPAASGNKADKLSKKQLENFQSEMSRTGVKMSAVEERFNVRSPEEMSPAVYEKVMRALNATPDAKAA